MATKKRTTAAKGAAKKAATKKAPAKKAAAKTAPSKKAPAGKVPVRQAPTKKVAATAAAATTTYLLSVQGGVVMVKDPKAGLQALADWLPRQTQTRFDFKFATDVAGGRNALLLKALQELVNASMFIELTGRIETVNNGSGTDADNV